MVLVAEAEPHSAEKDSFPCHRIELSAKISCDFANFGKLAVAVLIQVV